MADYDEKEDLMDRLLAIGKRKKFLSLDELHREIPENMMSPTTSRTFSNVLRVRISPLPKPTHSCLNVPRWLWTMRRRGRSMRTTSI
jgi:hypothetical protein